MSSSAPTPQPTDTVLVASRSSNRECYHTDPECYRLPENARESRYEWVNHLPCCGVCDGTDDVGASGVKRGTSMANRLEQLNPEDLGLSPLGVHPSEVADE